MADLSRISLIALDVDGVLTDGSLIYGPGGVSLAFSAKDGAAIMRALDAGLEIALVSFRDFPAVRARARDLGIELLALGCDDKGAAVRTLASHLGIDRDRVLFVGDDTRDLPAISASGVGACPGDAHPSVVSVCDLVSERSGGRGAVAEIIDRILEERP
jgi:3-deoxy-D-manno-octulosonate 8-phosphate phosphatase (KDO 8-P phosphatase)